MAQLKLLVLDVPIDPMCYADPKVYGPCMHTELLNIHREVINALHEDEEAVPYRHRLPEA